MEMDKISDLKVGNVIILKSKRFRLSELGKEHTVIEKSESLIRVMLNDEHKVKLSPPRGKSIVLIPSKYWDDFTIQKTNNKVKNKLQ